MESSDKFKYKLLGGLFGCIILFALFMNSQIETGDEITITMEPFRQSFAQSAKAKIPDAGTRTDFAIKSNYIALNDIVGTELVLEKISNEDADSCQSLVFERYSNYVLAVSKTILNSGRWNLNKMRDLADNNRVLMVSDFCDNRVKKQCLQNIAVVESYKQALSLITSNQKYHSIESSKKAILLAAKYANMASLKPCSDLMSKLNAVKHNLFKSHFLNVQAQVESNIQKSTKESLDFARTQITDFGNCASIYSKKSSDVQTLFSKQLIEINNKYTAILNEERRQQLEAQKLLQQRQQTSNSNYKKQEDKPKKKRFRLFHRHRN